jgi:hypothetical protein
MPAKGQFVVGPKIQFARVHGEARRGPDITAIQSSIVDFDDHLNFKKTGNSLWSIQAMYQLRPKWGIRYSFMPLSIEATGSPRTAFNFQGQTFASGTQVFSKWERFQHRGGIYFNLNRTLNSQTNVFADWMSVSDRLTISPASGGASMGVTWDETKNMAVMGLEFDKCLANYQGNTLALSGKGGVAFFSDSIGYEAEATLSYLIPIRPGRFGFIKGGYSYASLKKEKGHELFGVTIDGPFVQLGFLF